MLWQGFQANIINRILNFLLANITKKYPTLHQNMASMTGPFLLG
jgi:hypothetical protein